MYYYIEQSRDSDGTITGRIDITGCTFMGRDREEMNLARQSYPGYSIKRVTNSRKLSVIPPVVKPVKRKTAPTLWTK